MNNVIKRVWNQNKMVAIEDLKGMTFQNESGGHTFQISGVDDAGNAVALSGSVAGVFLRPDNTDVAITGSASGGVVSVTLLPECYDVPGRFGLTVFVTDNGQKTAVYAAVGTVSRTSSGAVAPGTTADVVDLINQINAAVATIPASWTGLMADIAPTYSASAVYPVGAYCYYNGDLYRCTTAITTAESWTSGHWTAAVLGNDVSDLKAALKQLTEVPFKEDYGWWKTDGTVGTSTDDDQHDERVTCFIPAKYGDKFVFVQTGIDASKIIYVNRVLYGDNGYIANSRVALQDGQHITNVEAWTTVDKEDAKFISFTFRKFKTTPDTHIYKLVNENGEKEKLSLLTNNISLPEIAGYYYLGPTGNINADNVTTQAKVTEYAKINNGVKIYVDYRVNKVQKNWLVYGLYDSAYNFLERIVLNNATWGDWQGIITINNQNARYIRFSYRTYGDCSFNAYFAEDGAMLPHEKTKDNTNGSFAYFHKVRTANHRGFQYAAPENTIPAFILSKKMGFDCVETDVQKTQDGEFVILHDRSINRTARDSDGNELPTTINIDSITYAQALEYDFGIWKAERYKGTKIPKLKEFLLLCKQIGLYAYIEIEIATVNTLTDISNILKMINECGMHNNVSIICNTSSILSMVRQLDDTMRIGHIRSSANTTPYENIAALKTDHNSVFETIQSSVITEQIVADCASNGVELECYLLNDETSIETFFPKISGVTSDCYNAQRVMASKKGFSTLEIWKADNPCMESIANLNYIVYDSSRFTEIVGNTIRQTRFGTGTNYGLISIVGGKAYESGAQSEASIKSIFDAGGRIDGVSLNAESKIMLHIFADSYSASQIETFGICISTYNETSGVLTTQFENPITPKKAVNLTVPVEQRIIEAVNENKNIMILFYRRTGGNVGDILTVSWEIEGLTVD